MKTIPTTRYWNDGIYRSVAWSRWFLLFEIVIQKVQNSVWNFINVIKPETFRNLCATALPPWKILNTVWKRIVTFYDIQNCLNWELSNNCFKKKVIVFYRYLYLHFVCKLLLQGQISPQGWLLLLNVRPVQVVVNLMKWCEWQ